MGQRLILQTHGQKQLTDKAKEYLPDWLVDFLMPVDMDPSDAMMPMESQMHPAAAPLAMAIRGARKIPAVRGLLDIPPAAVEKVKDLVGRATSRFPRIGETVDEVVVGDSSYFPFTGAANTRGAIDEAVASGRLMPGRERASTLFFSADAPHQENLFFHELAHFAQDKSGNSPTFSGVPQTLEEHRRYLSDPGEIEARIAGAGQAQKLKLREAAAEGQPWLPGAMSHVGRQTRAAVPAAMQLERDLMELGRRQSDRPAAAPMRSPEQSGLEFAGPTSVDPLRVAIAHEPEQISLLNPTIFPNALAHQRWLRKFEALNQMVEDRTTGGMASEAMQELHFLAEQQKRFTKLREEFRAAGMEPPSDEELGMLDSAMSWEELPVPPKPPGRGPSGPLSSLPGQLPQSVRDQLDEDFPGIDLGPNMDPDPQSVIDQMDREIESYTRGVPDPSDVETALQREVVQSPFYGPVERRQADWPTTALESKFPGALRENRPFRYHANLDAAEPLNLPINVDLSRYQDDVFAYERELAKSRNAWNFTPEDPLFPPSAADEIEVVSEFDSADALKRLEMEELDDLAKEFPPFDPSGFPEGAMPISGSSTSLDLADPEARLAFLEDQQKAFEEMLEDNNFEELSQYGGRKAVLKRLEEIDAELLRLTNPLPWEQDLARLGPDEYLEDLPEYADLKGSGWSPVGDTSKAFQPYLPGLSRDLDVNEPLRSQIKAQRDLNMELMHQIAQDQIPRDQGIPQLKQGTRDLLDFSPNLSESDRDSAMRMHTMFDKSDYSRDAYDRLLPGGVWTDLHNLSDAHAKTMEALRQALLKKNQ